MHFCVSNELIERIIVKVDQENLSLWITIDKNDHERST